MVDSETPSSDETSRLDASSSLVRAEPDRARSVAQSLLEIGAVKLRPRDPFTWSSGLVAPVYCDNRLTISYPRVRRRLREGFVDLVRQMGWLPATIAGTATAGIPHAAWLAEAVEQPMVYVRSSAKEHGTGARIEGELRAGEDVVLLEDLISTGGSALDAVAALRDAGARVRGVLAIFTYQLDAAETGFRTADVEGRVLTDFQTLIEVAHAEDRLSDEDLRALEDWRADPAAWSVEHGGERPD